MFVPKPLEATIFNSAKAGEGTAYNVISFIYKTVIIIFTGSGTATFKLQASNDNSNWIDLETFTESGYYEQDMAFKYIRGNLTVAGGKTVKADLSANK